MATFTVTNTDDGGAGSLRQALEQANTRDGLDEIVFADSARGTLVLTEGQLEVTDDLVIEGPGIDEFIIDADKESRVFVVDDRKIDQEIDVRISGVTISNGVANSASGISIEDPLLLGYGGGIFNTENLELYKTSIKGNIAEGDPFQARGSGIYNANGFLKVEKSVIAQNLAADLGLAAGGGIYSDGNTYIIESKIIGNTVDAENRGFGGGVYGIGYLEIIDSQVSENVADVMDYTGQGAAVSHIGHFFILSSEMVDNHAETNVGIGDLNIIDLEAQNDKSKIENSTISNNFDNGLFFNVNESKSNSVIFAEESAKFVGDGKRILEITNSTIVGNDIPRTVINESLASPVLQGPIEISSSIIAENTSDSERARIGDGQVRSGGNNLIDIGDAEGATDAFVDGVNGDIVGTMAAPIDPRLGPLADNGGPTRTLALEANSPALDAGANPLGLAFDQRGEGFPRVANGAPDIGAFERQAAPAPADLVYSESADRSAPVFDLDGAIFGAGERIYAFLDDIVTDIDEVRFFLDGELLQIEDFAPWDIQGSIGFNGPAVGLDTNGFGAGTYEIETRITFDDEGVSGRTSLSDTFTLVDLVYSESADRNGPRSDLDGATFDVGERIYAFVDDAGTDIEQVRFFVDGALLRTEDFAPWDIQGSVGFNGPAIGLDTDGFEPGEVEITTEIFRDLDDAVPDAILTDTFTLEEKEDTAPTVGDVVYSERADRSGPLFDLDGATFGVGERIYAFVDEADAEIEQVRFFLDGALLRTEDFAPWDIQGSVGFNGPAIGLDTDGFDPGSYELDTEITYDTAGGSEMVTLTDSFNLLLS